MLDEALERWGETGLKATGVVGDADPVQAVNELWKPGSFDEVIVSTLPGQTSRWLRSDVPYRIGRPCDLPVTHVVAMSMAKPPLHGGPPPRHSRGGIGILNVMAYRGSHPRDEAVQPVMNSSRLPTGRSRRSATSRRGLVPHDLDRRRRRAGRRARPAARRRRPRTPDAPSARA